MTRHLVCLIWNRKRQNLLLTIEIFCSFLVVFVVENVILTLAGGAIGLVLSALVLRAINQSGMFAHSALTVNARVFGWGVMLAIAFGIFSGVYPAWRMARLHPVEALKGGPSR